MSVIYVDNNATTSVAPEVFEAMKPFLTERYGNPSSMHTFGGSVHAYVQKAREQVATLIGAEDPSEIIFTSCGTESDNTAIWGTLESYPEKKHIITTRVEHAAVISQCKYFELKGYDITYIEVDNHGALNRDQLKSAISENTAIISIMWANNETGVIFPVEEVAALAKENNTIFHTDAVQAVGKIPFSVKDSCIDLLSLSGHKLHAPKGIGALYVKRGTKIQPLLRGGHQEKNLRGGTENVASIVALGKAAELAMNTIGQENTKVKALRDTLEQGIIERIQKVHVNGEFQPRLPNTTNIGFNFVEGESILLMLDAKNIAASSGSACTSGSLSPSHVLRAMDVPTTCLQGSVRFSLSRYTTKEEIDEILKALPPIIERLREISPYK